MNFDLTFEPADGLSRPAHALVPGQALVSDEGSWVLAHFTGQLTGGNDEGALLSETDLNLIPVALIERAPYLGGTGLNTGTIPSKTLRESALYFSGLRQRGLYGIDYSFKENLTIRDFMYRERAVVEKGSASVKVETALLLMTPVIVRFTRNV